MKPFTISELELLVEDLRTLVGGRVQKATGTKTEYGLGVWKNGSLSWLWIALDKKLPLAFVLEDPRAIKKASSPCLLFLNAHVVDRTLQAVRLMRDLGRIIMLEFSDNVKLEIRLFPHGCNLIVSTEESQVSWTKVQATSQVEEGTKESLEPRTPGKVLAEWLSLQTGQGRPGKAFDLEAWRATQREKVEKSISKIEEDIAQKQKLKWREAGEWLKTNGSLKVPSEYQDVIDKKLSLAQNIQKCFEHAKANEEKIQRAEKRKAELADSLSKIATAMPTKKESSERRFSEKIERRTLRIADDIIAYFGKSAQDNLKLLREAKAWDYWLHIKDYPSAHGIVSRPKNRSLSDDQMRKCALWLLKETLGKRFDANGIYDFIVTECRFVTPIRGDRIGRVTYKNEHELRVRAGDQ